MKKIIFSQRVETVEGYGERRDCIDIEVPRLIWECGYIPVPINNIPSKAENFLNEVIPGGIILTGGNDLSAYGGNAPERDETEKILIEYALRRDIPIYGFCRGMQMLACFFGSTLKKTNGHVRIRHILTGDKPFDGREVNSYHNMAVSEVKEPLIVRARSDDGAAEAISHKDRRVFGAMWHPERENPFDERDILFIKKFFDTEAEL